MFLLQLFSGCFLQDCAQLGGPELKGSLGFDDPVNLCSILC